MASAAPIAAITVCRFMIVMCRSNISRQRPP
jgi:hypothetical protein